MRLAGPPPRRVYVNKAKRRPPNAALNTLDGRPNQDGRFCTKVRQGLSSSGATAAFQIPLRRYDILFGKSPTRPPAAHPPDRRVERHPRRPAHAFRSADHVRYRILARPPGLHLLRRSDYPVVSYYLLECRNRHFCLISFWSIISIFYPIPLRSAARYISRTRHLYLR